MVALKFHPEVFEDIAQTVEWYEANQPGLGARFYAELESAYLKISEAPHRWSNRTKNAKQCPLERRFPFRIIFTERSDTIWIIAVAHTSRRPNYWAKRLKDIP